MYNPLLTVESELRQAAVDLYLDRTKQNPWNRDYTDIPEDKVCVSCSLASHCQLNSNLCGITLAVHGTDLPIARSIAQTGFANLSSLGKLSDSISTKFFRYLA